jgi:hypothetical protein
MFFQRNYWKLNDQELERLALKYHIGAGTPSGYDRNYATTCLVGMDTAKRTTITSIAAIVSIAATIFNLWFALAPRTGPVETTSLVLRDAEGKRRASLATTDGSPSLMLYDGNGTSRAALGVDAGGRPLLQLFDEKDKVRASIAVAPDAGPVIALLDASGKIRFSVEADAAKSKVGLYDADSQASANLAAGLGGGALLLEREPGADVQLAMTRSGQMVLTKGDKVLWNIR